jgi:hypothetical protein
MSCAPKSRATVIAIVVALLLVASPSLVVASASGRPDAGRASSSRGGPVVHAVLIPDHVLAPTTAAGSILHGLAPGVLSYLGGLGFGWVLGQFGLGDGVAEQIGEIQNKLLVIESRLRALEAATSALRVELAQGTYSGLVAQATPIIADVNQGMADLDFISRMRADDPTKKGLTEETLKFIHDHLMGSTQRELADRMSGTAGGDGLIVAAYKTVKANTLLWTRGTSNRVREVFDYYLDVEAPAVAAGRVHARPPAHLLRRVHRDSDHRRRPNVGCARAQPAEA